MPESEPGESTQATLRLLGPPALQVPGRNLPFTDERRYQLLAYLACKGGWVRRDELADLLYPGRAIDAARSNLRKVLLLARRVEWVGAIEQNNDLLRWQPDSDLKRFERACDAGHWADAVSLYGGPLLQGLDNGWPADAAEWLAGERSRLEARWRDAGLRRLRELRDDPVAAEALAQALLRQDPLDDDAMQVMLDAQGRQGRAGDALHALQGYAQQLSASLGLEPSAALQGLGSVLRGGAAPRQAAGPLVSPERGDIVGRRQELARITEDLTGSEARLLTLVGPGGIGKTALARAAFAQLRPRFTAGSAWVELETIGAVEQVPPQIAVALGLAVDAKLEPWAALTQALREGPPGPRVVVLDNAEHLALAAPGEPGRVPALAACLAALLQAVPGLRVLATSRTALGVRDEWRVRLEGLPLPDADETDADVLRANDAVRLFERQALPLAPGFVLADEAADVVQLVRAVEGLPLAICMLAAWRRLMPVREIVAELRESLELLEPSTPHERSVRAAFERSWQQLTPVQQRVLGQLALLPQPVDREMLRAVVQAPLPVVASLVDRSLVRADGEGHFALHPLIRRQAEPHAVEGPVLLARHAHHLAQRHRVPSRGGELATLDAEIEHLRAAWSWAVCAGEAAVLRDLAAPLALHDCERGPLGHALPALREAAAMLEARLGSEAIPGPAAEALARLLDALGDIQFRQGDLRAAEQTACRTLALVDSGLVNPLAQADALMTLYSVHWQRGDLAAAEAIVPRYRAAACTAGDRLREAHSHSLAGLTHSALGRHESALESYAAARTILEESGETASLPTLLNNMGSVLRKMKRPREAILALEEGLQWARRHAAAGAKASLLTNLAVAYEDLGDAPALLRTTERALEAAREVTEPHAQMRALLAHGRALALHGGGLATALRPVWQALRLAERMRTGWERHTCLISAARTAAICGCRGQAVAVLHWVVCQSGLPPEAKVTAEQALAEMGAAVAEASGPGVEGFPAVAIVEDVLATLAPEPTAHPA